MDAAATIDANLISLDYGRRRVGVAGSSAGASIAFGITTLRISDLQNLLDQLQPILREREVRHILLGLPITLGDKLGNLAPEIMTLKERLEHLGYCVLLVDEALSSRQADQVLRARGGRKSKADRDRASAAFILQEFLDGRLEILSADRLRHYLNLDRP